MSTTKSPLGVSDYINIRSFLENWGAILTAEDIIQVKESDISAAISHDLNVGQSVVKELQDVCGKKTLKCPLEPPQLGEDMRRDSESLESIPAGLSLSCTLAQANCLKDRKLVPKHYATIRRWLQCNKSDAPVVHRVVSRGLDPPPNDGTLEALITVRFYHPLKPAATMTPIAEFQVIGSQCLTELRDVINCRADYTVPGEFSMNPDSPRDIKAKDLYKGGFFYIEGVMYDDLRDVSSISYSDVIIEWAKDPSRGIGPFRNERMEEFRFVDLSIRLGLPYVYMHQGTCEHLMVFTDVRLLHKDDCWDESKYPLLTTKYHQRQSPCLGCPNNPCWVVKNSIFTPSEYGHYCDFCFRKIHYGKEGEKLCDFEAYCYPYKNSDHHGNVL